MDNCITCSSLCCSSPDRSVQNPLQATQFSVSEYNSHDETSRRESK
ncbi:MAG: hypothetical protein AABX07_00900 [Nanoarchaeota archaeon]